MGQSPSPAREGKSHSVLPPPAQRDNANASARLLAAKAALEDAQVARLEVATARELAQAARDSLATDAMASGPGGQTDALVQSLATVAALESNDAIIKSKKRSATEIGVELVDDGLVSKARRRTVCGTWSKYSFMRPLDSVTYMDVRPDGQAWSSGRREPVQGKQSSVGPIRLEPPPKEWPIWSNEDTRDVSHEIAVSYVAETMERYNLMMPRPTEKSRPGQSGKRHALPTPDGANKAAIRAQYSELVAARVKAAKSSKSAVKLSLSSDAIANFYTPVQSRFMSLNSISKTLMNELIVRTWSDDDAGIPDEQLEIVTALMATLKQF